MTSIKVKFRPSKVADREGVIFYQIIHNRKVGHLTTAYHVFATEWDEKRGRVIGQQTEPRKSIILSVRENIRRDIERLSKIVRMLEDRSIPYSTADIVDEFNRFVRRYSIFNYMEEIITRLKHDGKQRTSETYRSALNSFMKFRNGEDLIMDCLTSDIMESYEAWHKARGVAQNTISFYTRILRAVYNRAVEDEVIEDRKPFKHVYTGVEKTVKRALPIPVIKKIKSLDLSLQNQLDYARDMFMLSFYMRGMSFVDMCYLKKSDLKDGAVTYRRRKTGQKLSIEWTTEMQTILDKYLENTSDYLIPIIKGPGTNEHSIYRNTSYNINRNLKKVAQLLGLNFKLTMYVARHSWASAAKTKGIPLSVISEGMGHGSEATTRIYLCNLETSAVDKANSVILNALK